MSTVNLYLYVKQISDEHRLQNISVLDMHFIIMFRQQGILSLKYTYNLFDKLKIKY